MIHGDPKLPSRFWSKAHPNPQTGCWEWVGAHSRDGYGHIKVEGKVLLAHRYAYITLRGEIDQGLVLDHLCRTPACVNPAHLEPVPHCENVRRGKTLGQTWTKDGQHNQGAKHGMAKLTEDQVVAIFGDPRRYALITAEYGVSAAVISTIKNRKAWGHVTKDL